MVTSESFFSMPRVLRIMEVRNPNAGGTEPLRLQGGRAAVAEGSPCDMFFMALSHVCHTGCVARIPDDMEGRALSGAFGTKGDIWRTRSW